MKQYTFVPDILGNKKKFLLYKLQKMVSFIQLVLSLLHDINQHNVESH